MTPERIAEIRQDAELEAEGLEPGYWQDTIMELLDALTTLQQENARLQDDFCANHDELMKYRNSLKIGRDRYRMLERIASRAFHGDDRAGILTMEQLRSLEAPFHALRAFFKEPAP